jgi:hypothetical protein
MKTTKLDNDKYYTPVDLAKECIDKTFEIIGKENITEIIEPSAGNGSFSNQIANCIAYDLVPESDNIKTADFLDMKLGYKSGRLFIGNPPFGVHNKLVVDFYDKCCDCGDYIAFILPISCYKNDIKLYKFDLIYSEDLGLRYYTDRELHCCFNIYRRPDSGAFNFKPNYELNEITIIEHRRKKGDYQTAANKEIKDGYCYAMCNWGDGCLGKVPNFIGEYAQEVYFYCSDERIKNEMLKLLEFDTIREYASSISSKKISVMKLYKYFYENIDGLTLKNDIEEVSLW